MFYCYGFISFSIFLLSLFFSCMKRSLNSIYLKGSFHQLQAAFIQEFELFCGKIMFCFSLSTGLGKEYHATLPCLENETFTGLSYAASSGGVGNSQQQIGNCFLELVCLQIISPWLPQSSLFIEKKRIWTTLRANSDVFFLKSKATGVHPLEGSAEFHEGCLLWSPLLSSLKVSLRLSLLTAHCRHFQIAVFLRPLSSFLDGLQGRPQKVSCIFTAEFFLGLGIAFACSSSAWKGCRPLVS